MDNLQLAHFTCNRSKSDSLMESKSAEESQINRDLPQSINWTTYRGA